MKYFSCPGLHLKGDPFCFFFVYKIKHMSWEHATSKRRQDVQAGGPSASAIHSNYAGETIVQESKSTPIAHFFSSTSTIAQYQCAPHAHSHCKPSHLPTPGVGELSKRPEAATITFNLQAEKGRWESQTALFVERSMMARGSQAGCIVRKGSTNKLCTGRLWLTQFQSQHVILLLEV